MSTLALGSNRVPPAKRRMQRTLVVFGMLFAACAMVWGAMNLIRTSAMPRRQVARIMILPDTPPPPPPPDEARPPPREVVAHEMNIPKPETPPAPAQLKMEGQAGEGPSAFAAGDVKQDYIGGDIGNGSRYSAYVSRLEQRIQAELTRHKLRVSNVRVFVWLAPDGAIKRYSVEGGDAGDGRAVRTALEGLSRMDEAPLADMPMPVGLTVN
jgi:periplasmic protein TonB